MPITDGYTPPSSQKPSSYVPPKTTSAPTPSAPKVATPQPTYQPPKYNPMDGKHVATTSKEVSVVRTPETDNLKVYQKKIVGNKGSNDTRDYVRGGGAQSGSSASPAVKPSSFADDNRTGVGKSGAGATSKLSGSGDDRRSSTGGSGQTASMTSSEWHELRFGELPSTSGGSTTTGGAGTGKSKPSGIVRGAGTLAQEKSHAGPKLPGQGDEGKEGKEGKTTPGGQPGETSTVTTAPKVLTIDHSGNKNGATTAGATQTGSQTHGATISVVGGPVGSGGLTDKQKVEKFSSQIGATQGKLDNLNRQEGEIRQAMATTTDPEMQNRLAMQLGNIEQQQQKAMERLNNKQNKLEKVQNRMAAGGAGTSGQEGQALAVTGLTNAQNERNLNDKINTKNERLAKFSSKQSDLQSQMAGTTDPEAQRRLALQMENLEEKQRRVSGTLAEKEEKLKNLQDKMAAANAGSQKQGGKPAVVQVGGNGKKDGDKPTVASISGSNGGRPNTATGGKTNANVFGGADDGRPNVAGGGNHATKKENDTPNKPVMGGMAGGGKNDSLPTNPPKLVSMGNGGGLGKNGKKK